MDDAEIASQYDEAILAMVNRLMDPGSKYRIFKRWVNTIYAEGPSEIQLQRYYRALDFFEERKEQMKCNYMGI
ncbi:hypothetical protein P4S76_10205 [Bacillus smithii]